MAPNHHNTRRRRNPKRRAKKKVAKSAQRGMRRRTATQAPISDRAMRKAFSGLKSKDGCAALLVVAERCAGRWEHAVKVGQVDTSLTRVGKKQAGLRRGAELGRACEALAAAGHPKRIAILAKLLEGPGTYRSLQHLTGLKAGPLYHHINQLRLASLILPKQRDLYELTRGGRNLILVAMVVGPLAGDRRRRPLPGAA